MSDTALIVLAKAPVAGRSKTRLCPPCTFDEAAKLAAAALSDTLAAVLATPVSRRVLALDGEPGDWLPNGFEVIPQRAGGLGERLAGAFDDIGGPALLVGMDTPQLDPALLEHSLARLRRRASDVVLGAAPDGGYWAIGLRRADARVFEGVPMSSAETVAAQRRRLSALGLEWEELPELRDVDTIEDARTVAAACPGSRFAAVLDALVAGDREAA
ncbi:MAG: TIGR04282 family arsenosugar biosynthesis glycosyltransferase [Thermoleophilaceae bacterium]|nr:TIGR04282 family arsenosugar biosynthesis glycosyltransferase [Thermoleophilaceae bacterium]